MARNVGEIEVIVSANTGRMTAKLTKDGAKAGKKAKTAIEKELSNIEASIDFQTGEAKNNARLLRKEIEATLAGIDLELDLVEARAQLREFDQEVERLRLVLDVNAELSEQDLAEIQADYQGWKARVEADKIQAELVLSLEQAVIDADRFRAQQELDDLKLQVEFEEALAAAELDARIRRWEEEDIAISVDLESAKASAELNVWLREQGASNLDVDIDLAIAQATAAFDAWLARESERGIDVDVDPDTVRATLAFKQWVARMEAEEDIDVDINLNEGSTGGGGRGLSTRMKAIFAGIIALAEPLGVLLQGSLAAATSIVSSAFAGLGSAAGGLVPVFAALGASVATLVIGFQGMGDALGAVGKEMAAATAEGRAFNINAEDIHAAMAALTPAAQDVVRAFAELSPQLQGIKRVVQSNLFAGLGDSMRELGETAIPAIGAGLADIADSFNRFFKDIASAAGRMDFAGIFEGLQPVLDNILDAITSVFESLEPFLKAAAPAAKELSESFKATADSLKDMVTAGAQSGGLTEFLMGGVESLRQWWDLTRNIGDALATLFEAGKSSGDSFIQSLSDMVKRWDDWMESIEGQEALKAFFDTGRDVMNDLKPVLSGLKGFFENLVSPGALGRFEDFAESVGNILPMLGSLLEIVGRLQLLNTFAALLSAVADALEPIIPALQQMADAVGIAMNDALRASIPLLEGAAEVMEVLAGFVETVAGVFSDLPGPIQTTVVALGLLIALRGQIASLGGAFLTARDNITLLGPAMHDTAAALQNGMKGLGPALSQLGKSAGAAAGTALAAGLGIAFGAQMALEADDMSGQVMGIMSIIGSAAAAFAAGGPVVGGIALAMGGITALFQHSQTEAKKAAAEVNEYVSALAGIGPAANKAAAVSEVLSNLTDESESVREAFIDMGFSVGEWARELVDGTSSAQEGMADFAASFGPAGEEIAAGLRDGTIGIEDFAEAIANGTGGVNGISLAPFRREMYDMGLSLTDQGDAFDFLLDEGTELVKGQKELERQAKETGAGLDGLSGTAEDSAGAFEGATIGVTGLGEASAETQRQLFELESRIGNIDIHELEAPASSAAREFIALSEAFDESAASASAMKNAFTLLVGGHLDVTEAVSNVQASLDDLTTSMEDQEPLAKQTAAGFDLTSEAGRTLDESIRTGVEAIGAWSEAAIRSGTSTEDAAVMMEAMRQQLIDQASQYFTTREEAEAYINSLGLTPENITTLVNVPGLLDAMSNLKLYDSDLDGLPDVVDTTYNAPGLDLIKEKLGEYGVDLTGIDDETIRTFFEAPGLDKAAPAVEDYGGVVADVQDEASTDISAPGAVDAKDSIEEMNTATDEMPSTKSVTFTTPGLATAITKVGDLDTDIAGLTNKSVAITVTGVQLGIDKVNELDRAIDALRNKTITVTTINRSQTGNMTGSIITGPTTTTVGEKGYAEAIVPLQLPLNRVDPSVREFAELLRGGGANNAPVASGTGKTVNNYLTITPQSADPSAVATQIMNRSASLANR